MTASDIEPPDNVPEDLAAAVAESTDAQRRALIHYAQRLLRERPPLTDAVESREGEELVRVEDHGSYTYVVVERPEETGLDRGPFAYRVKWEPEFEDHDGKYRWHYLGRVDAEEEDE